MTVVKICGLTTLDDALAAAEAGAGLLGFVLVASSPRYVAPERAREIVAALRRQGVRQPCVGVVAGLPLERVLAIRKQCGFDLMQLHDEENFVAARALYPDCIVARRVSGLESLAALSRWPAFAYLLDARGTDRRTPGSGPWDWRLLRRVRPPGRIIVAGGLVPENVAEAVREMRPWGVDVSSGVECAPGRKNRAAMERFIARVCEVDSESSGDRGKSAS